MKRLAFILVLLLASFGAIAPAEAQNVITTLGCASNAVNCLQIGGALSGSNPTITAVGADTNVGITLVPKGSGSVTWTGSQGVSYSVTATSGLSTASLQTFSGDLTLVGTGIGKTGSYLGGVMGEVFGASTITSSTQGSNTAGIIGKFSIAGTSYYGATKYPHAGVIGEASGRAHAAVMAIVSDSTNDARVTIEAMYGVHHQFGYIGAGNVSIVNWGLDLQSPDTDVYTGKTYTKGAFRFPVDFCLLSSVATPTDGTSGTGANECGIGSLHVNSTDGKVRTQTGTKASPTWTIVGTQS